MSAQQLALRCAELGLPTLTRSTIANLESGRRQYVDVAELLILAAALQVAPAVLVFPVGYEAEVERLPGQTATPLDAVDQFSGTDQGGEESALALLRRHRELERMIRGHYRRIWEMAISEQQWHGEPDGPEALAAREVAAGLAAQLHDLRAEIAARGLELPPAAGLEPDADGRATEEGE